MHAIACKEVGMVCMVFFPVALIDLSDCLCVCRCKMYPDMAEQVTTTTTTTQTLIMGVAPSKGGVEAAAGAENGGCKCGANCTCDPCTCK
jgi:hypothetical protein